MLISRTGDRAGARALGPTGPSRAGARLRNGRSSEPREVEVADEVPPLIREHRAVEDREGVAAAAREDQEDEEQSALNEHQQHMVVHQFHMEA